MKQRLLSAALAGLLFLVSGCSGSPAPDPSSTGPAVQTDWSALTPYEGLQTAGRRFYPEYTDTLLPRGDYGPLIAYTGASLTYLPSWTDEGQPWTYHRYGLATLDGTVVTDPVFESAYPFYAYRSDLELGRTAPFLILTRTIETEDGPELRGAVAAPDGSWCTGFDYLPYTEGSGARSWDGYLSLADVEQECVVILDTKGREVFRLDRQDTPLDEFPDEWWLSSLLDQLSLGGGFLCWQHRSAEDYQPSYAELYDLSTGEILETPELIQAYPFSQGLAPAQDAQTGLWGYLSEDGNWAISPVYSTACGFLRDCAIVTQEQNYLLIDRQGTVLRDFGPHDAYRWDTYIHVSDSLWLDEDLREYPLWIEGCEVNACGNCFYYSTGEELVILTDGREYRLPVPGWLSAFTGETALVFQEREGPDDSYSYDYYLMDLSGNILFHSDTNYLSMLYTAEDSQTPVALLSFREDNSYDVLTLTGEFLFNTTLYPQFSHGLYQTADSLSTGLRDSQGNWVLRLPSFDQGED